MSARLEVKFLHYWHCGGSRGGGAVLDARVHRDRYGLPRVPGRHLKGLLRAACECGEAWGWDGFAGLPTALFGDRTEAAAGVPRPGALRVADATLPTEVGAWLGGADAGRRLVPGLFRSLHATRIDTETGSAKDKTLRGIEVVVPLTLQADIDGVPGQPLPPHWADALRRALPLVTAVGAHRSRGLGRAVLMLEEKA